MGIGDLVKIRWVSFAEVRRARRFGPPVGHGLIVGIEKPGMRFEVIFPETGGKLWMFPEAKLEKVS